MSTNLQDRFTAILSNPHASRTVIPVIFEILEKWSFSVEDQIIVLGLSEEKTLRDWRASPENVKLTFDLIERISYILGIFKSLEILLPDPQVADNWLSTPNDNPKFKGTAPKSSVLSGLISDLAAVRNFLKVQENT